MSRQQQEEIESLRDQLKVARVRLEQKERAEEKARLAAAAAKAFKRQEADRENITKGLIPVDILRGLVGGVSTYAEPGNVTQTTIELVYVEGNLSANERRVVNALRGKSDEEQGVKQYSFDLTLTNPKVGDTFDFFPSTAGAGGLAFIRANGANA